ncbi:hypothetical protein PPYR_12154 [Photinus pyralis]|uniref:Major facilitator superfamily (MFS) profile domain-containing protein n=1 Tax=Photinus pyralis TaxID=7054 RepID=A0A5N4ADC2_PHOPY|nr:facilitated trehalose transporter Tret1-like isoform X2 [Photinus pyralis]XP_031351081.1 facilitated trehalose transporter Tret1-like isoform X2 [Photinus pyralis]KAB0795315.1 hypothetical protein PPYR_12154 [Photinus pyralis]
MEPHKFSFKRICSGRRLQAFASIIAALNAVSDGMHIGWSSPIIPRLLSPSSPIPVTREDVPWLENSYMVGVLVAVIPLAYLSDQIGRKMTILVACVIQLSAWVLFIFATTPTALIIARLLAGIGGQVNYITTPVYVTEISDKGIRGRLGSIVFIMGPIGILTVYALGAYTATINTYIFGAALVVIILLIFPMMPESPYYLLLKDKKEEARTQLMRLRSVENVDEEIDDMIIVACGVDMSIKRFISIFTAKGNLKALIITMVLNASNNFSGFIVLMMNMETIFSELTANISASTFGVLIAVVVIISSLIGASLLDCLGRRMLLILSCFLTSAFLMFIAIYLTAKGNGWDLTHFSWVPIVAIVGHGVTQKGGIGLIPILLSAEIFPRNLTAMGCAFGSMLYSVSGIASLLIYQYANAYIGVNAPFYIFGAYMLFAGTFCVFMVPETKKKSLHETQELCNQKVPME